MDVARSTAAPVSLPMRWTPIEAASGARRRLALIRAEMAVEDASGERNGRVMLVHVGQATPDAAAASDEEPEAANVAAELAERLRRLGYVKIADTRYFRRDFRYYVTPDQVLAVQGSVVRLDGYFRDLITAFD